MSASDLFGSHLCGVVELKQGSKVFSESQCLVYNEELCFVNVNGRELVSAIISPNLKKEFALGFLITEGIISDLSEIESVMVEENRIGVITTTPRKIVLSKKTVLSGCGGSGMSLDYSRIPKIPYDCAEDESMHVSYEHLSKCMSLFMREYATGVGSADVAGSDEGLQSAAIFENVGGIVALIYDQGRDTAVSKVVGCASLSKKKFSDLFLLISGRVSADVIRKCLFAGIGVIGTCGLVSESAALLAAENGVTLLRIFYDGTVQIYSCPKRVV